MKSGFALLLVLALSAETWAAGRARSSAPAPSPTPPPITEKKVIALAPIGEVRIEMPDQSIHDFGADFQAKLESDFTQSGKYILVSAPQARAGFQAHEIIWTGSATPSATIRIEVTALSFQSGARGDRMFYGFNERLKTPFNDGTLAETNEFPLRLFGTNWFGHSFDIQGGAPFDSAAGLDLGEGIDINVLFAWLSLKYASYQSELALRITVDSPVLPQPRVKTIRVHGSGFFYDLVGAYSKYSAGITIARTDAMGKAFQNALDSAYSTIEAEVSDLPLLAKVDGVLNDGRILLGTGLNSPIPLGAKFTAFDGSGAGVVVTEQSPSGAVANQTSAGPVSPGMVFEEKGFYPAPAGDPSFTSAEGLDTSPRNFPAADLGSNAPQESLFTAWLQSLADTLTLPYRIYRYFSYDQVYHQNADGETQSPEPRSTGSIVAVIDSGVDYNHPKIHGSLWLNPSPTQDANGQVDHYGWDFISGDAHPYDDGYHGTEMASAVLSRAPGARIMPLKVFNPWGITSSAAIYGAFVYAVDHGAEIILCGWATDRQSLAITRGVEYARDHGVLVVAAAGDEGLDLDRSTVYPASLSSQFKNLIVATALDSKGALLPRANTGGAVSLAIPAQNVTVATPRLGSAAISSSDAAAALVAGELAARISEGVLKDPTEDLGAIINLLKSGGKTSD